MKLVAGIALFFVAGPALAEPKTAIRFQDVSEQAGLADIAVNSTGPAFADYDNDGDLDIYIPAEALSETIDNRLWENNGDGTFTNVAVERGVDNDGSISRGASWGDFDNDGDQDLAISNIPPGQGSIVHVPTSVYKNLLAETGEPNFENITRSAGVMRAGNAEDAEVGGVGNTGAGPGLGLITITTVTSTCSGSVRTMTLRMHCSATTGTAHSQM